MKLTKASELTPYIKAIVFGPPGAGKTTFGVSGHDTPGLGPVLVADAEEGTISAAHTTAMITPKIESRADIEEVLHGLHHRKPGFEKFKTVVIDTGTRLQMTILDDCIARTNAKKGATRDLDDVYLKDWGDCGKVMKRLVSGFFALDMHVIILAHARDISPRVPEGKPPLPTTDVVPDFTPALARTLMGYADYVWYINESGGQRHLLTAPCDISGLIRVKTRGHKFAALMGAHVVDPSLANIYKQLKQATGK